MYFYTKKDAHGIFCNGVHVGQTLQVVDSILGNANSFGTEEVVLSGLNVTIAKHGVDEVLCAMQPGESGKINGFDVSYNIDDKGNASYSVNGNTYANHLLAWEAITGDTLPDSEKPSLVFNDTENSRRLQQLYGAVGEFQQL